MGKRANVAQAAAVGPHPGLPRALGDPESALLNDPQSPAQDAAAVASRHQWRGGVPIVPAGDWRIAGRGYRTSADAWLAETVGVARAHQRREAHAAIRAAVDLLDRCSA